MKKLILILFALFCSAGIFAQTKNMNVEFGGKSYVLNLCKNKTEEAFIRTVGKKNLSMKKYGGFEFYKLHRRSF